MMVMRLRLRQVNLSLAMALPLILISSLTKCWWQPLKELLVVLLWLPLEVVDLEETGRSHLSTLQAFNHRPNTVTVSDTKLSMM